MWCFKPNHTTGEPSTATARWWAFRWRSGDRGRVLLFQVPIFPRRWSQFREEQYSTHLKVTVCVALCKTLHR